ncbi:phytanoyl-CoA dioxygenase family protein [Limobrevibacterium gyesilva]|uniref:Phytanoyl-CoA dioxygenase family protein n=1 Tax=Limobrevibacterium gyesilva TaxID=2991712 RepID=A0AA41YSA9_9PROT|nr:phytanoyl-CoA dioxygenase family protein [Limobrevibacterium gyesilva]MCW3475600.1 phytanoyl-CoA dioxygenase family protein [Limobrevibacterium gyesilva]
MDIAPVRDTGLLGVDEIAQYRRDGYVVIRNLLGPRTIAACVQALSDLATGRLPARETQLMFETGVGPAGLSPADRELHIRKYMDYVEDAPALKAAANSLRLHRILDQILGQGRVLFQEMALVKPPRIGSEKPWHQDAAYFRVTDPGLIAGVWIALDPALKMNGCMELVAGSHLDGAVPHVHENDFNRCRIIPPKVRARERIAIEMQPGDALVFHSLLHHFTAPNKSDLRRRAIQFHYHQTGAVWGSVEDHQRLFHDETGAYAGCTVPHGDPAQSNYTYRNGLPRRIEPVDTSG